VKNRCDYCGTVYDAEKLKNNVPIDKLLCAICYCFYNRHCYPAPTPDTGKTLTITLDCEDKYCGKCELQGVKFKNKAQCLYFGELKYKPAKKDFFRTARHPSCIAACGGGK